MVFEIKPEALEAEGAIEAQDYINQLRDEVGVEARLGDPSRVGTHTVKGWGFNVEYWSPQPGVIVYNKPGFPNALDSE